MSSYFIYNSMNVIDEKAIDSLSLVAHLTDNIIVKSGSGKTTEEELSSHLPRFLWLLRDFSLKLEDDNGRELTPREYLENALRDVSGNSSSIAEKNEIRRKFRSLFPDRDCFTIIRPVSDEEMLQSIDKIPYDKLRPKFKDQCIQLVKKVRNEIPPKTLGGNNITGSTFIKMVQSYVDAINTGSIPNIHSTLTNISMIENQKVIENSLKIYKEKLSSLFETSKPVDDVTLLSFEREASKLALDLFSKDSCGDDGIKKEYKTKLKNLMQEYFIPIKNENNYLNEKKREEQRRLEEERRQRELKEVEEKVRKEVESIALQKIENVKLERNAILTEKNAFKEKLDIEVKKNNELEEKIRYVNSSNEKATKELENLKKEITTLKKKIELLEKENKDLLNEKEGSNKAKDKISKENAQLAKGNKALSQEKDSLLKEKNSILNEKESILKEKETILREKNELAKKNKELESDKDKLNKQNTKLMNELEQLKKEIEILKDEKSKIEKECELLKQSTQNYEAKEKTTRPTDVIETMDLDEDDVINLSELGETKPTPKPTPRSKTTKAESKKKRKRDEDDTSTSGKNKIRKGENEKINVNPDKMTKTQLKQLLVKYNVAIPPTDQNKSVYVDLFKKHLGQKK